MIVVVDEDENMMLPGSNSEGCTEEGGMDLRGESRATVPFTATLNLAQGSKGITYRLASMRRERNTVFVSQ